MSFTYDNQKQTINGIHFHNADDYRTIRDSILFNVFEGWQPTNEDVNRSIYDYYYPSQYSIDNLKAAYGEDFFNHE